MSQSKKQAFDLSTFPWKTAAIAGAAVAGAAIGGFLIGRRSAKDASNDAVVEDKIAPEKKSAYKTPPLYTFKAEYLREFTQKVFEHFGASEKRAARAADVLAAADLRGIDSHGVARLHAYFELLEAGAIEADPKVRVVRGHGGACVVDGGNGLGLIVGPEANDIAIQLAKAHGVAAVTVCNTNHYGIAGWYSIEASKQGMIGVSMTNTTKLVAPCFGAERMLGTNPIAVSVPCKDEPSYVMDMATSCVAYGKVEINHRLNKPVPDGWCIDKKGQGTNDPAEMKDGGALLMLGSDRTRGAHKGYCLSSWVDIMTAVLSGANWGPYAPPFALRDGVNDGLTKEERGKGIGHFFMAFDVSRFRPKEEFGAEMDKWVRRFRETKPVDASKPVLIPGDPEREFEGIRGKAGVPLTLKVVQDLEDIAVKIGVPFDRRLATKAEHLENMPEGGEADPRAAAAKKRSQKGAAAGGAGR